MGSMRSSVLSASSLKEPILIGEKTKESPEKALTSPVPTSPPSSPWSCLRDSSVLSQSSKNSSGVFCRICHEGELGGERLISPCLCSGSVGLLHRSCVEKWLSSVNKDTCELCHQKYRVSRHSRPFSSWLLTPAVGDDQRNLMGDAVCFILLTPLTTISAYLCASGASYYLHQIKKSEAVGLLALAALLILIYLVWLLLTIRYHFQVWFKWRLNNQDIRLLDVTNNLPVQSMPSNLDQSIQNRIFLQPADLESAHIIPDTSQNISRTFSDSSTPQESILEVGGADSRETPETGSVSGWSKSHVSLPLCPTIIPSDPQRDSVSKVIKRTKESVVYAQISKDLQPQHLEG